jgi:uncharacterized phage protein (TIGR02216 family)
VKSDNAMPWAQLMAFGLGRLRLPPEQFWAMTPREIAAAMRWHMGSHGTVEPMGRNDLNALVARFPDQMEI